LPRTPIKETERRATQFEERFGEGATELDALEALHPGELRRIIEAEIARYYDDSLDRRLRETVGKIQRSIGTINQQVHDLHRAEITELESDWAEIASDHESQIEEWIERAETSAIEWPEPVDGDEDDDPLFDSTRDYVEQIDRYKKHQDRLTARKKGNGGTS
jgi:hypothetical protein